jgi:hypothetical protein
LKKTFRKRKPRSIRNKRASVRKPVFYSILVILLLTHVRLLISLATCKSSRNPPVRTFRRAHRCLPTRSSPGACRNWCGSCRGECRIVFVRAIFAGWIIVLMVGCCREQSRFKLRSLFFSLSWWDWEIPITSSLAQLRCFIWFPCTHFPGTHISFISFVPTLLGNIIAGVSVLAARVMRRCLPAHAQVLAGRS